MEAFLAALPQLPRGGPQGSPEKISRPGDSLCFSGFGRCQVLRRALQQRAKFRRRVELVPRRALRHR
eukprot:2236330-Pyramimonas_sp.AAC.1